MKILKKLYAFLRSMRFGILLLVLIAAFSIVGTVIPQGREIVWYVQNYPRAHAWLLMLRIYDIFNSWYFQLLLVLLVLNLTLCSLLRIRNVVKAKGKELDLLLRQPQRFQLTQRQREKLRDEMSAMRCKVNIQGDTEVYRKNSFGRYGSFLTHLSILLTVIFGALALYLPQSSIQYRIPGESIQLEDGTEIAVQSFRTEDATGRLDYISEISVQLPDGQNSGIREIRVNHPLTFGSWKIYQQTYGTAGVVTVRDLETTETDTFILTHLVLLSKDGINGIWYEGVYDDPAYQVETVQDGKYTPALVIPGDTLQVGDLEFGFEDPMGYPGLRVKYTPRLVNVLLCAAFLLMIAGLYITFFRQPVLLRLDTDGCAVGGSKPEGMLLSIQQWMEDAESGKEQS